MKSIVTLLGVAMLLSCENNIKEVKTITSDEVRPELSGTDIDFFYTDSTRLVYRAIAPEFIEIKTEEQEYKEFPKGGQLTSFKKDGSLAWQIKAQYAKNLEKEKLWELRTNVEAITDDGKKINTELMYWDQKKKIIYSDQYVRITTADNQYMEGNSFTADDNLNNIELKQGKGEIYLKDEQNIREGNNE